MIASETKPVPMKTALACVVNEIRVRNLTEGRSDSVKSSGASAAVNEILNPSAEMNTAENANRKGSFEDVTNTLLLSL